jgi:hypothetical protein
MENHSPVAVKRREIIKEWIDSGRIEDTNRK